MRLIEAIIDANHRALNGDAKAGLHPSEFAESLPIIALTCIDTRLNRLMPEVLGVSEEQFIWLRCAGNIISGPISSTMRSIALACVLKGGKEILIIGHTDCRVRKTTAIDLTEKFRLLGVPRSQLPDNLPEFFGLFASESQNVIKGVEFARRSPLIAPHMPVHGLLVDVDSGRLDWIVNGYQTLPDSASPLSLSATSELTPFDAALSRAPIGTFQPDHSKIGNIPSVAEVVAEKLHTASESVPSSEPKETPVPLTPPIPSRQKLRVRTNYS